LLGTVTILSTEPKVNRIIFVYSLIKPLIFLISFYKIISSLSENKIFLSNSFIILYIGEGIKEYIHNRRKIINIKN
jgi:hypothetical protein